MKSKVEKPLDPTGGWCYGRVRVVGEGLWESWKAPIVAAARAGDNFLAIDCTLIPVGAGLVAIELAREARFTVVFDVMNRSRFSSLILEW